MSDRKVTRDVVGKMRGLWNRAGKRRKYITGGVCLTIMVVIPMMVYAVTICNACRGTGLILEVSRPCTDSEIYNSHLFPTCKSVGYIGPVCRFCGGTGKLYSPAEIEAMRRAKEEARKREEAEVAKRRAEEERKRLEYEKFLNSRQTFTDPRDGKKYPVIKIGGKTWMAGNLDYEPGNSWCYKDNESNCAKYGRLYDWNTAQWACPAGWHLPSRIEWGLLTVAAGGTGTFGNGGYAGKKLKSRSGWNGGGNGTDDYGFSALSGGRRYTGGSFGTAGDYGSWWTATEYGSGSAYYRDMDIDYDYVGENYFDKDYGFSVRCVGDN